MKKIFSFLVIFGLIVGIVWVLSGSKAVSNPTVKKAVQSVSETTQKKEEEFGTPQRLVIRKLGVDAAVESVGLDSRGRMDVPRKDENVAWYNLGYKPGQNGSAVLAGHFDTRSGSPAVFYNIGKLESGDTIEVFDTNGKSLTYTVTSSVSYDFDEVPLQEVFATKGKTMLNLITCEGTYDQANQNYSKRLVVYSKLAE